MPHSLIMKNFCFRFWLLALLLLCGWGVKAQAQVVVYRLKFDPVGESINYRPYQMGYYVAPMEGGAGSLVLTQTTGNQRQYFAYESFGELFVAVKGETKKMVLSATAANDVSTTVFYALGTANTNFDVESRNVVGKVKVAGKMTGYAISADSEQDLPFYGTGISAGVAGMSELTAQIDQALTNKAVQQNLEVSAALDAVVDMLVASGHTNGRPENAQSGGQGGGQ